MQQPVKGAIYRHYKNKKLYRVLDFVRHSESLEEMVLYEALYESKIGSLWVRPLPMFLESVRSETGENVSRFQLESTS